MVEGRRKLELDRSLIRKRGGKAGAKPKPKPGPKEGRPFWQGGMADRGMAVSVALAVLILVVSAIDTRRETWVAIVLLGLVFLASEWFALPIKSGGRLSLALLPVVIAMMHTGPLGVALVPLFGIPIFYSERGGEGAQRVLYNASQYVFCAGAAGLVFWHTGGDIILKAGKVDLASALNSGNGEKLIVPWLLATVVFFVFNTVLVAPALAGARKERVARYWEKRLLGRFPGYVLYSGIGFLGAVAYSRLQFTAVVLLAAPLLVARVAYTRFAMMRDVCDDTTLAVMKAVESASIFSEGHSVGVAGMAAAIAEEMDFHEEDLHFLRQAALLHDIGLLALDPALVDKPGPLTPEEYEEIKKHPLIGARIVSNEESLAVIAPTITHHHEQVDGSGYVDGLTGDTIPIGARILAVADAFDAMQRRVPYREPLGTQAAASEIVRAKGIVYDPGVVDAFVKVVTARGQWSGALTDEVRMPGPRAASGHEAPAEAAQLKLEETTPGPEVAPMTGVAGATPADGIAYDEVRGDIEKDMREWKRSDSERPRRRARGEPKRRAAPLKKERPGTLGAAGPHEALDFFEEEDLETGAGEEPFYEEQPESPHGDGPPPERGGFLGDDVFEESDVSPAGSRGEEPEAAPARPRARKARGRRRSGGLRDTVVGGPRLIIPLIAIAALATLVMSIFFTHLRDVHWGFWFYLALFIVAAQFDVEVKGGGVVNLGLAPLLAALLSIPPVQVVWIFLFGTMARIIVKLLSDDVGKDELLSLLLDYAGVGIMALLFQLVVKVLPKTPEFSGDYWPGLIAAVVLAAVAYFFVQLLGTTYVLSQEGYFPAGAYLSSTLRRFWLPYAAISFSGMLMGLIYRGIGMWSVLFVLPFLLVIRYAYNRVAATDQYLLETVRTLAAIPEETGMVPVGHAGRVARLSVAVARELGLAPEDASQVEYAAYLHDIGAITRVRGFDFEQEQLMELEGVIAGGGDVLGRVEYLRVASEILKGREGLRDRVDDAGKRKAVSMGAGILRAVDDFECLVQGGEDREPLPESDALSEMNLERGVKYDSKVLRAIARVLFEPAERRVALDC